MTKRLAAVALTGAVLLSGCSVIGPPGSENGALRSNVKVDTPELRAAKAQTNLPDCEPGPGAHVEGGMPDLTLPCLGGGTDVNLASLRGPMVINVWAAWCPPCRRELPIYEEFHLKHGDQVKVLGIDFQDTQPGQAIELARETGISYPQLADPNSDMALAKPLPNIPGMPGIIFVDSDGVVVDEAGTPRIIFYEIKDLADLERLVTEHLGIKL